MTIPSEITPADIGRIVRYSSIAEASDSYSEPEGWHRSIVSKELLKPVRGILLGRSTRRKGAFWWDEDDGNIIEPDEAMTLVAMVMPLDDTTRYRRFVAVLEWEYAD